MHVSNSNGLITEEASPVIHLELKVRLEIKVKVLVQGINYAASRLPEQYQDEVFQIIDDWGVMFFSRVKANSWEDKDCELAAKAILFLRFNNIQYIMFNYVEDPFEQAVWMGIYDQMDIIVKEILPKGQDPEQFIETERLKLFHLNQSLKREVIVLNVKKVHAFFDGIEAEMCQNANRHNLILQQEFEAIKQDLLDLNAQRLETTQKLNGKIDIINKKVMKVLDHLGSKLKEVQDLEKKMRTQESILEQLLDEAESVLEKVK